MLVHLLTASGAVVGLWALVAASDGRFGDAFAAMVVATIIDSVDGWLARRFDVTRRAPHVDGARLDDIVDYFTFVIVPAFVIVELELLPVAWEWPVAAAMLLSSAYGFARTDAKTDDAFTGFPSYWNIVSFYLAASGLPRLANAAIVVLLAALVFVRIGYVYPSKTAFLRRTTLTLGAAWGALLLWLIAAFPAVPRGPLLLSLAFPAYYVMVSALLEARRRGFLSAH